MRNYCIALPMSNRLVWYMTADQKFPTLLPLCCLIVCCFSPVVAYWLSLTFLVVLSSFIHKIDRRLFSLVVVLSGSAIWASRAFSAVKWDDFVSYYQTYTNLYKGDWSYLYAYGHGIEMGLPIIFLIFSWILPKLTPHGLMFFQSVLSGVLFLWMSEKYLLKIFDPKKHGIVIALCLLFYSFSLSTQLSRQFFAMLILLPVLFEKRIKVVLLWTGISFFIHMSSFPIFFIYRALVSIKLWVIIIIIPTVCLLIYFSQNILSENLSYLFSNINIIKRFNTYSEISTNNGYQDLSTIKRMLIPVLSLFAVWLWSLISQETVMISREEKAYQRRWIVFYFSVFLLYMSLIEFGESSHRIFLTVYAIMLGWLVALFLKRLPYTLFLMASCFILAWQFLGSARQAWDPMIMPGVVYPLIDVFPGYFFLYYFA